MLLSLPLVAGVPEAVAYLEAEVPRWKTENGCYSCHNNGDGARALIAAGIRGSAVADSLQFLLDPLHWNDPKPLARVQYASVLARLGDRKALTVAARLVAESQSKDGHWQVDEELAPGSSVTYGPVLGTAMARDVLRNAGGHDAAVARATAWLEARKVDHPLDVAALVLALGRPADIRRLKSLQQADGGWNGEAFDTAVSVLALTGHSQESAARGRAWLVKAQLEPGGWRGTTRPAGGPSYAQHISTTAWALLALLSVQ